MDVASPLSKALFLWVEPAMWAGYRRPLGPSDMLPLPEWISPAAVHAKFAQLWAEEVARVASAVGSGSAGKKRRGPSVLSVLWRQFGARLLAGVAFQTCAVLMKFGCVLLLRRLTGIIVAGGEDSKSEGALIAVGLALCNCLDGLFSSHATWQLMLTIYAMMGCFAQAVFKKGFLLHPGAQGRYRRGDLVNMALSDCSRLVDMSGVLMVGVSAPIMLLVAMSFLVYLLGPMVLVSLVSAAAVVLVIQRVGQVQGSSFRAKAIAQGKRLSVLNEMLQSVRFTKFYALEDHYEAQIREHRRKEIAALRWMKASLASSWPLAATVPLTTAAISLSLYLVINGDLPSAPDTLAVLAIARFMYFPFAFFGSLLGGLNMLFAVTGRIGALLLQPELSSLEFLPMQATVDPPSVKDVSLPALSIKGRDFRWGLESDQAPTLKGISIEVPRGELWAIVGPLGSGKSSLLAAALGGVSACGAANAPGVSASGPSRTFVSQEPMIMNATLRDNVLFGIEGERDDKLEMRYRKALEAAALERDLEVLPAGDETEIGEKGLTLSGGQKARVALARAVLSSQPNGLVLLDDPLAAVDAHVGTHLFEKCIVGALDGTTRLLVTNQLQFLDHPSVARVLVMQDGRIIQQGKYAELNADPSSLFSKMVASLGSGKANSSGNSASAASETSKVLVGAESSMTPHATGAGKDGRLTKKEKKNEGAVTFASFQFYFKALGGLHVFVAIAMCSWLFNLGEVFPDLFLAAWQDDLLQQSQEWYLVVWLLIGCAGCALNIGSRFVWVFTSARAADRIHSDMLRRALRCTTSFFDQTPSGRIMSRFGEDQMLVDFTAPLHLEVTCISMWSVFDQLSLASIVRPLVTPFTLAFGVLFMAVRELHRRANREAMRWNLVTKSPLFNAFEETLSGVMTIQAFGREAYFQTRFERALRENLAWMLTKDATNLWMEQRLFVLGALVVGTLGLQMVFWSGTVSSSIAAVSVIFALQLGFQLKTVVYFLVQTEGTFASVERVMNFNETAELEPERRLVLDTSLERQGWPSKEAGLVFENVCMRYLAHMPLALDGLSASLEPREKVGIVGRTGSGKSSIMGALFRLFELESGRILLEGVDIATCGVALVRQKITIVPQDPVLFSGDLRKNLDPLGSRTDKQIWDALRRCMLDDLVQALQDGLASKVAEGGRNFSVGERQVLCLARALLRGTRVLCLDEATANVDPTNDRRIQRVLTQEVKNCLVLTIAHRLHTVLRSDRIMVLDQGRLAQLDSPEALLQTDGIFRELAKQAGIEGADTVKVVALEDSGSSPVKRGSSTELGAQMRRAILASLSRGACGS